MFVFNSNSFVENIPKHVNGKGGFDSMAEFVPYERVHWPRSLPWHQERGRSVCPARTRRSAVAMLPSREMHVTYVWFIKTLHSFVFAFPWHLLGMVCCIVEDTPYDTISCLKCCFCYRGIHRACVLDATLVHICSHCVDPGAKKGLDFEEQQQPTVRFT